MSGPEGWDTGRAKEGDFLTPLEAAAALNTSKRTVNRNAAAGRYPGATKTTENGVEVWRIPFASLPPEAQANHLRLRNPLQTPEAIRDEVRRLNAKTLADAHADRAAGLPVPKTKLIPAPILDDVQRNALWARWEKAPPKQQERAKRALTIMQAWARLEKAGKGRAEIEAALREQFGALGTSRATLWRNRQRIEGQSSALWAPLLLADYWGGRAPVEIAPAAWEWFVSEWGIQSKPAVSVVYRRYRKEAAVQGWKVPSVDWFADRLNEIPVMERTYMREGANALQEALPPIVRDYETLPLHSYWCSDFRKLDLWCEIGGEVCRPHMIAWQELRTRKILAWRLVTNPNPDAVRLCFRDAMVSTDALPVHVYVDNGMEYAAKCNTGGATRRNRFKKRDDEVWGLFTLLSVEIVWSIPGNAQSKPIESFWAGFKQNLENRREFEGAYIGASPDQRPENAAPDKERAKAVAVPEARIREVIAEEIAAFNARGHRGRGMEKRSPDGVMAELAATPELLLRKPSAA